MVAAFYGIVALSEFSSSSLDHHRSKWDLQHFPRPLLVGGVFDLAVALIALGSGISMLRGGLFGLFVGLCRRRLQHDSLAVLHPGQSVLAVVIIIIDAFVELYALTIAVRYFADSVDI